MSIVTIGSVRGAPGVTTTALLVASGIPGALLVEADLAGGVLAIRYGLGREPGLTTLAAARADGTDGWEGHAQNAGGVPVLVGPDAPESAEALWRNAGSRLAATLQRSGATVIADVGRLGAASPLVGGSDLVVILVRPIAEQLVALSHLLPLLRGSSDPERIVVVLAGEGPYRSNDVGPPLGVQVIGDLPEDRQAASQFVAGGRSPASFARTQLARAGARLSADIALYLRSAAPVVGADR